METTIALISELLITIKEGLLSVVFKSPPKSWGFGTKGNILLVPGQFGTWYYLRKLGNYLNHLGYKIYTTPSIEPNIHTISYCAKEVKDRILALNLNKIIIIGHSKGGLIARNLLIDKEVYSKIKKVITISTPHLGTLWGYFYLFNIHELIPNSHEIERLSQDQGKYKTVVNLYSKIDPFVVPNKSLILKDAKNIVIGTVGHKNTVDFRKTLEVIENHLGD